MPISTPIPKKKKKKKKIILHSLSRVVTKMGFFFIENIILTDI